MTAQPGLVSVVMPMYNGEEYLDEAIQSVLAQTYAQWELVVVDDGSTDSSAAIVQGYDDPRIRYAYQENGGQAAALNHGLDLAIGEFVTTLDTDDFLPLDSLKARVNYLQAHIEHGIVYGDGFYTRKNGEPFLRFTEQMPAGVTGDVYDTLIVSPFYGTGATVLIRRNALNVHNCRYDDSIVWCQDWDFYVRLAEHVSFGFVEAVTIYYRLHDMGMTMAMPHGRRLDSFIRTKYKILASPRFEQVPANNRSAFFYDFLMQDLDGRIDEQNQVFASVQFAALPDREQSRLLRVTSVKYLLQGNHLKIAKRWLRIAWSRAPLDGKTAVVTSISMLNTTLAQKVVRLWQNQRQEETLVSPFETVS